MKWNDKKVRDGLAKILYIDLCMYKIGHVLRDIGIGDDIEFSENMELIMDMMGYPPDSEGNFYREGLESEWIDGVHDLLEELGEVRLGDWKESRNEYVFKKCQDVIDLLIDTLPSALAKMN